MAPGPPGVPNAALDHGAGLLRQADGWDEVSQCFDERRLLNTPLEVALERLTLRHTQVWSMTRAEAEGRVAANDRLNIKLALSSIACLT